MTTFWADIHPSFQSTLDVGVLHPAGTVALAVKVSEGTSWHRDRYHHFSLRAREEGLGLAAYHFLRSESSGVAQAHWTRDVMRGDWPRVPVMLDWETSVAGTSANANTAANYIREVRRLGGRVSMLYCPRWYWSQIGSPSLAAEPFRDVALVQSSYGANNVGTIAGLYPGDGSPRWTGYASRSVEVLQYGSRCRIPGYSGNLDINAYRGTERQLRNRGLFYWSRDEESTMSWSEKLTVPPDFVRLFPPESPVPEGTAFTAASLLWRTVLYTLGIGSSTRRLEIYAREHASAVTALSDRVEIMAGEVSELLRIVREGGSGDLDTAAIIETVRQETHRIRLEAPGAVRDVLRDGVGEE